MLKKRRGRGGDVAFTDTKPLLYIYSVIIPQPTDFLSGYYFYTKILFNEICLMKTKGIFEKKKKSVFFSWVGPVRG